MNQKIKRLFIFNTVFLLLPLLITHLILTTAVPVRGKSPAARLSGVLDPIQQVAQDVALSDPQVQGLTLGRRSEVFGVREMGHQLTEKSRACETAVCRQVEIYSFDTNSTVTVIVNVDTREALDVLYQPGLQPGINRRLADLALQIAFNDPGVIDALGFRPQTADMAPVAAGMRNTTCDQGHLCAGPTFRVGDDRILWAVVDLTTEEIAGLAWTEVLPNDGSYEIYAPEGGFCPDPGSVNRDGWTLDYEVTNTDGFRVYDVTYQGHEVLTSVTLPEWHVDYNGTYPFAQGFFDVIGCGGGGGGFPIYPFGQTEILDLTGGFEVVQDFRMPSWGAACNYRYEQHMQFWSDGRFRIVSGAFGQGCGIYSVYRPIVRIDIAVDGDDHDAFGIWDGAQWTAADIELYRTPYAEAGHGPHAFTEDGSSWWVMDTISGTGYTIAPGQGQFNDGGRGDAPFLYVTQHKPEEGDTDLPIFQPGGPSYCCNDNHLQGPDIYLNGESINDENIVIWYVAQHFTEVVVDEDYYCWTENVEMVLEPYPCFGGPLFVPFGFDPPTITADFTVSSYNITFPETAVFTNTSTISPANLPVNLTWDFGDSQGFTGPDDPSHQYVINGVYTPTLTIDAFVWGGDTAVSLPITVTAENNFMPLLQK